MTFMKHGDNVEPLITQQVRVSGHLSALDFTITVTSLIKYLNK